MRGSWWGAAADVKREEWPFAAAMSCAFFLVITSFWILKPLKKAHFIEFYEVGGFDFFTLQLDAAQAELLAKVLNMFVAALAAIVFSVVSSWLRREKLFIVFAGFFVLGHSAFAYALSDPGAATIWSFYLYGDLFSTLMVVSFFAFLNDVVDSDASKRLYGLAGLGGVAGGAVGSLLLASFIDHLDTPHWLLICVGIALLMGATAALAGRFSGAMSHAERAPRRDEDEDEEDDAGPLETALRGVGLATRSRYLLAVMGIVGIYELVSTLMDFQFTSAVEHHLDGDEIGSHFSFVYAITNSVSLAVQLFLTSFVMTRFGVGTALLFLPVAVLGSSASFLLVPTLWTGSLLSIADNSLAYSIHQSSKESLYVPTTPAEKYQAKAFIDMWVQRFAKAMAVVAGLGITVVFQDYATVRWISLGTFLLLLLWLPCVRYVGRRFEELEDR
jgi:AAA family ATP:ADP antiporter